MFPGSVCPRKIAKALAESLEKVLEIADALIDNSGRTACQISPFRDGHRDDTLILHALDDLFLRMISETLAKLLASGD